MLRISLARFTTAFATATFLAFLLLANSALARDTKVAPALWHLVMVNPALIPGDHDFFLAGNDAEAKATVRTLAEGFGWRHFNDMGDIVGARATEAILPLWIRLYMTGGSPLVNIHVLRA